MTIVQMKMHSWGFLISILDFCLNKKFSINGSGKVERERQLWCYCNTNALEGVNTKRVHGKWKWYALMFCCINKLMRHNIAFLYCCCRARERERKAFSSWRKTSYIFMRIFLLSRRVVCYAMLQIVVLPLLSDKHTEAFLKEDKALLYCILF